MLILCEGVDGGGKSTLAKAIVETHRAEHVGDANPPTTLRLAKGQPTPGLDALEEYELALEQPDFLRLIHSNRDLVVMDRWHAGEIIYGELYRGGGRLTAAGMLHVEMMLTALGAIKVLVQPSRSEEVVNRLKVRGDDFLRMEHVDQVHSWYESHGQLYRYIRASRLTPSTLIEFATSTSLDADPIGIRHWPGYVGDPAPHTLLVGDQRNDGPQARPGFIRAFTPCGAGNSSAYLLNALLIAGAVSGVGMVNAHESGVELKLINELPYQVNVVALGSNASRALTVNQIDHEIVPHPQWWRRFRHGMIGQYADALKEAARWKS